MESGKISTNSRMDVGIYALNKLAGAGTVLVLLSLLSWGWPQSWETLSAMLGAEIPMEHWVYGYALIASLVADAIISLLPALSRARQAAIYGAAGFLSFALLTGEDEHMIWLRGVVGMAILLIFVWSRRALATRPLRTILCALIIPLFCLL